MNSSSDRIINLPTKPKATDINKTAETNEFGGGGGRQTRSMSVGSAASQAAFPTFLKLVIVAVTTNGKIAFVAGHENLSILGEADGFSAGAARRNSRFHHGFNPDSREKTKRQNPS